MRALNTLKDPHPLPQLAKNLYLSFFAGEGTAAIDATTAFFKGENMRVVTDVLHLHKTNAHFLKQNG